MSRVPPPRADLVIFVAAVASLGAFALVRYGEYPSPPITPARVAAAKLPEYVSPYALLGLRCCMLSVNILATCLKLGKVEDKTVFHQSTSKLQPTVQIHIQGAMWFSFFTVQCWALQCFYLVGSTLCSVVTLFDVRITPSDLGQWFPGLLWMSYEVSFAVAVLVSAIVKYVLIPTCMKNKGDADNFFGFQELLMHNCNTLFMSLELLFNDLPFTLTHFPLAVLWGFLYVFYSWWHMWKFQCCWYDFLDPTLPNAIAIHTVLVLVLGIFFAMGAGFAAGAEAISSPVLRISLVIAGVAAVSKTGILTGLPKATGEKTQ
eukprot:CAMPEP_0115858686 /NCGR_PEP_ID=MMETSP0287-20121206/16226_1 /TAXON_ID=412157 /ORGANISM="Chrysochromulina rotalis, Strain UIO044" /LENGTH=316 /DNA_ID=CAMNT_0003312959 /DNA_START=23 /DNA_END=973 /DNA_ORIENTATION=+